MSSGGVTRRLAAVLFDLDGTLIDSAPDLAGACNDMRVARNLPRLPLDHFRPMVGSGARGMVGRAFEVTPDDERNEELREEFLKRYEVRMTRQTRVFPLMVPVLLRLSQSRMPWGIVTNKATRFAVPLVRTLQLDRQTATLVCGDTVAHSKPHPAPLLEASRQMNVSPEQCVYVGDDLRDVEAGRAAGMLTVAAGWGYLGLGEPIDSWGADHVVASPRNLLNQLGMA